MLQDAFSFRGRIGRLHYFLAGLVMWAGAGVAVVGMIVVAPQASRGGANALVLPAIGLAIAWLWLYLSLHVRRIRDIGLSPLLVILGWLVFRGLDAAAVAKMPWLAASQHHTWVIFICNSGLSLVLLLYPGRRDDDDVAPRPSRLESDGGRPSGRPDVAMPRLAAGPPRPSQVSFGRRGLR